jgi:hypothetical protein
MSMLRLQRAVAAIPVMACAVLLIALASPAAAQSEACVHLQVGSGYAATMSVVFGDATIGPSDTFDIGQTQCLSLADVPDGEAFSVLVHADLGDTETCTPANIPRSAALPVAITFNASGTTLNVHCDAPTGATLPEPKPNK